MVISIKILNIKRVNRLSKILIIEDNKELSIEIKKYIEKFENEITLVESIAEAMSAIKEDFDLALLDINLPDGDGMKILSLLKEKNIKTIITTVKNDEEFIVKALDEGADDYIVKPFSLAILRARIDLALRDKMTISSSKIQYNNFILDEDNVVICYKNENLDLTKMEFDILSLFIKNPHKIFTRNLLLEKFWDNRGAYVNDNTLTVTIKRIREKISGESITTIRGIGYRLD